MKVPGWMMGLAVLGIAATAAVGAQADDAFQVSVSHGQVVVTAAGAWHINPDFPWKLTVGDTKLGKDKFTLTEKNATIGSVPTGPAHVHGGICSAGSCRTLDSDVTVP